MIAGPNGSGKTTLTHMLADEYAVNFYAMLNADDIFAEVRQTGAYMPPFSVEGLDLADFAARSTYGDDVKRHFAEGRVFVLDDCIRFATQDAVNTYTVALVTGYLQEVAVRSGRSSSQETVFSHPSKVEALERAKRAGFRTYLYFVATELPSINLSRIANRVRQGGHVVPDEKVVARYGRSLEQVSAALPFLSRAYFFDNSGGVLRYLAEWNQENGMTLSEPEGDMPRWFVKLVPALRKEAAR